MSASASPAPRPSSNFTANSIASIRLKYWESRGGRRPFSIFAAFPDTAATSSIGWPSRSQQWRRSRLQSARMSRTAVSPVESEMTCNSTKDVLIPRCEGNLRRVTEIADPVTMDKIVSLCRRRGFVFPSSEIYGGIGSTYDYGHYGVLAKNNIRSLWFEAMVQERDDIVALDSAIILNPRVWEASGHVAGFTDPLVDCRTCKLRFRADKLEEE